MAISADHRSNFAAIHRQWWRLQMSEKFSSGTKNSKQTKKHILMKFDHLSINKRDGILKFMP